VAVHSRKLVKSTVEFALSSYVFQAGSFLISILLVRSLSPEVFGEFAVLLASKEVLSIIFGVVSPQYFVLSRGEPVDFENCLGMSLLSALGLLLAGLVAALFCVYLEYWHFGLLLLCIFISQGLDNIASIFFAPVEKKTDFLKLSILRNSCALFSLITVTSVAIFWESIWVLVARELLLSLSFLVVGYFVCDYKLAVRYCGSDVKKVIAYSYKINLSRAAEILFYRAPDFVLSIFTGVSQVGAFFQSRSFLMIFLKVPNTVLDQTLFASFVKLDSENAMSAKSHLRMLVGLSRLMTLMSLVLALFGSQLFVFIYGNKWVSASYIISDLSWFIFFAAMFNFVQAYCYAKNMQSFVSLSYLAGILVFGFFVTNELSSNFIKGISHGVVFGMAVAFLGLFWFSRMFLGFKRYLRVLWLPFTAMMLSYTSNWMFESSLSSWSKLGLITSVSVIVLYEMRYEILHVFKVLRS
jgi:O-antigen/teichoic acid export membrane protein